MRLLHTEKNFFNETECSQVKDIPARAIREVSSAHRQAYAFWASNLSSLSSESARQSHVSAQPVGSGSRVLLSAHYSSNALLMRRRTDVGFHSMRLDMGELTFFLVILFTRPSFGLFFVAASFLCDDLAIFGYLGHRMTVPRNMVREVPLVGRARCHFSHGPLLEKQTAGT